MSDRDLDDLLQRIELQLQRRAGDARLGATPVGAIMRRGARRRARHRTVAAAGALTVGAMGVATSVAVLTNGGGKPTISGSDDGGQAPNSVPPEFAPDAAVATTTAPLTESPLVWNAVAVDSAEALAGFDWMGGRDIQTGDGALYQLSTQPGRSDEPRMTVYRSDDGIRWAPTGRPAELSAASEMTAAGDRLYAVGTAPATSALGRGPHQSVLASSEDGGATWVSEPLPVDVSEIAADPSVSGLGVASTVAYGPAGLLIAARPSPSIDIFEVTGVDNPAGVDQAPDGRGVILYDFAEQDCPQELTGTASTLPDTVPTSTVVTDTAADSASTTAPPPVSEGSTTTSIEAGRDDQLERTYVGGPQGDGPPNCFVRGDEIGRRGWAELGVAQVTIDALNASGVVLHPSDGGFTSTPAPAVPAGFWTQTTAIHGNDDGYVLLISGASDETGEVVQQTLVYTSVDGAVWQAAGRLSVGWVSSVGWLDDGALAIAGSGGSSSSVAVLRDGAWQTTDLGGVFGGEAPDGSAYAKVGPAGIVAIGQRMSAGQHELIGYDVAYSPDGVTWSRQELDDITGGGDWWVTGVIVTGDSVVVGLGEMLATPLAPDAPLRDRTVLVGTLR